MPRWKTLKIFTSELFVWLFASNTEDFSTGTSCLQRSPHQETTAPGGMSLLSMAKSGWPTTSHVPYVLSKSHQILTNHGQNKMATMFWEAYQALYQHWLR